MKMKTIVKKHIIFNENISALSVTISQAETRKVVA